MIPDLAVHVFRSRHGPFFELHTFEPDVDDEGKTRDYGVSIIEGGTIVGDGSKSEWDANKILVLLSAIEHAPEMISVLRAFVNGLIGERQVDIARRILKEIESGELKYKPTALSKG